MNTKHTHGQWAQAEYSKLDVIANGDTFIATARDGLNGVSREQAIANARLIAAAPDLLAALQALEASFDAGTNFSELAAARDAIAKATGGAA